jgi:ComF family protein
MSATTLPGWWKIWDAALNLIYTPSCQVCRGARAEFREGYVCAECWSKVRFITPPFCERCGLPYEGSIHQTFVCGNCEEGQFAFRFARSAVLAGPLVLNVVHHYKYNGALYFEPFLADLLVRRAVPELGKEKWDAIVPVPLHPVKERERQFNQAERLAAHLGRALGLPVRTDLIRRVKPTATQTRLNRTERAGNMEGAFAARNPGALDGERIIIFDDVLTTGATTSACAQALRAAGAGDLCAWTLARGA